MSEDIIKKSGTVAEGKDDRGGANLISHPVIGIVKNNVDPTHSGKIQVYIARFGGPDPDDGKQWTTVKYMSPFAGVVAPGGDPYDSTNKTSNGQFIGNPQSYGFWASAPDIGSQVICIFINGDPNDGYYMGCVPISGLTHMTPAIAAGSAVVPNEKEADLYGGATRLPVSEINYSNPSLRNSTSPYSAAKPVHSYQANILAKQGLIRDDIRGVISSSSQRETPSRVYGISTPGPTIYEGGYSNPTIKDAINTANEANLSIIGRVGGHSIVMDDGTVDGEDQLMRFRTSAGHMIMMSDSGQVLTIMHSNGNSYIEFGKEGTVDIFTTNSVNVRTEGDLNYHAERDINLHAVRNLNLFAGQNVNMESGMNYSVRAGLNFQAYSVGSSSIKSDGSMSFSSIGPANFSSTSTTNIKGMPLNLNTGTGIAASTVPEMQLATHVGTTFSQKKGWMFPGPNPVSSIATRTPTHMPWAEANKGVAL